MSENPLLIILGPTASGKTKLAVSLADALNGEVISADSRQVFKGMDIGTGKDLDDYQINGKKIPYHLIDHKDAGTSYQVNAFKEDFYTIFNLLISRHKLPVLCGGTGMYIHSLLQNHIYTSVPVNQVLRDELLELNLAQMQERLFTYPLSLRAHVDHSTLKRVTRAIEIAEFLSHHTIPVQERTEFKPLIIGLMSSIESRRERIRNRLEERLQNGMVEEVQKLLRDGVSKEMLVFYGLEYKFIVSYLSEEITLSQLRENLYIAICQYAKRQMTFFRKMEKDGVKIHWFDVDNFDEENMKELKNQVLELHHLHLKALCR